jgi:hypothetical protein
MVGDVDVGVDVLSDDVCMRRMSACGCVWVKVSDSKQGASKAK